jgi:hypothetical protein
MAGTPHEQSELLAHFLAARDIPCPSCGYNLRDLRTTACPECGQPLNVRLDAADPRTARYLACVLALGGAASVMATELGVVLPQVAENGSMSYLNTGEQFLFVWYPAGVTLAALIALCLLIRRRGRAWFHAGSGSARTMLAALCVTASAGCVVAWVLWFQWMMFS